jgi:hypothetical protein
MRVFTAGDGNCEARRAPGCLLSGVTEALTVEVELREVGSLGSLDEGMLSESDALCDERAIRDYFHHQFARRKRRDKGRETCEGCKGVSNVFTYPSSVNKRPAFPASMLACVLRHVKK